MYEERWCGVLQGNAHGGFNLTGTWVKERKIWLILDKILSFLD